MEYFLTNPQPNLDLSRSVIDTLNFVSVFGLYPNIAVADKVSYTTLPGGYILGYCLLCSVYHTYNL